MQDKYLLSVIIPTYNRSQSTKNLIYSLLNQINDNFEIIIVDDGSTDTTLKDLNEFKSKKNISLYSIKNSERGAARNYGAKKSQGQYLNFFDSDDIALNIHIETAINKIKISNFAPVINLSYAYKFSNKIKNVILSGELNKKIFSKNILSCNGVLIKKNIFNRFKFSENRDLSGSEDWHLWLRLSNYYKIISYEEITTYILDNNDRSMKTQTYEQVFKRINYLLDFVNKKFKHKISYINLCKIRCELYSFLAMTACDYKNKKIISLKFLILSFFFNPITFFSRRSIRVYYKLIILW